MVNVCTFVGVIDAMEQVMAHIRRNDPEDDAKREFLKDLNNSIIGDFNVLVVGRVCYSLVLD